jgi:MFS family permease
VAIADEQTEPKKPDPYAALRHRDFRKFFLAALASNSGSWLQGIAIPFIMYEMTGSGAWVGVSVFSLLLPMAIMGPWAGPLADRLPRRTIVMVSQTILAFIAFGYAIFWWSGVREPLAYIGLSISFGIVNGFGMPAWQAYVSDLVPRDALQNAITLNSLQFNAARAIGPSIGGVVLALFGPAWCFAGNSLSFFVVVLTLHTLPPTPPGAIAESRESPLTQFRLGMVYARHDPAIMTGYFAAALVAVCGGTLVQVHLVLFAEDVFEVSAGYYGILVSAFGLGAIMMAPWLMHRAPLHPASKVLVIGLLFYGVGELILTSTSIYVIGLLGTLIAGCSHITMATTTNSALQLHVNEAMRGRVMAMYLMVLTLGMPFGAIIEGPLSDAFGVRVVVSVMGGILIAGGLWLAASGRAANFDRDSALAE